MILLIFLGILSRLIPHPANFTAVGGIALFSGSRFRFDKALLITSATMFLSDVLLGFHPVMWSTYAALGIAVLLGRLCKKRKAIKLIIAMTLLSSVVFFLITNFAVWLLPGSTYPKTISGLLQSYILALPFFRNSLLGNFFYTTVFFGGYELVTTFGKKYFDNLVVATD